MARTVLEDCRTALATIHDVQGSDWRWRWVAVVALLRSVGLVLYGTDREQGDDVWKQVIDKAWSQSKPPIFRDFIEEDRNNIIHEYRFRAGQSVRVFASAVTARFGIGTVPDASPDPVPPPRSPEYGYPITEGPYKGRDQHDVATEAIAWWEQYLDAIEAEVARLTAQKP